jgi:glycine cleavage system transcriptional repressor
VETNRGFVVFTAVGPDRPGLVNQISSIMHQAGANIEDSRMAILGGEFALILLVSGSSEAVQRVKQAGARIESELGLHCLLKETTTLGASTNYLRFHLRVTGVDRPGIVQTVTGILADRGVNLAALESRVSYAPLSGTPMFVLEADLQVPATLELAKLRAELAVRCEAENLDFTLESAG